MAEKKRRAKGGGSIRYIPDKKLWEARFVVGVDPGSGKPIRKSVYAKTEGQAMFNALVNHENAVKGVFYQNIEHESEVDVVLGDLREDTQENII